MSLSSINLDAFYTCAQTGSFTVAAEKLFITQSALSQRIKNLESDLNTTLFIRDRSGIKLTEQGYELLRYCQAKDSIESEVIAKFKKQNSKELQGHIRIGGFSSVMRSVVLPALKDLLIKNPDVQMTFVVRELAELAPLLKSGAIDFMIYDRILEKEDLVAVPLGIEKNVLVEKKNYSGPDLYLDHDEEDQMTIKYLGTKSKNLNRRYVDDVYGLLDGVRLGLGRAVVPLHLVQKEKDLTVMNPNKTRNIQVVLHYYHLDYYSELQKNVIESLKKNCVGLLGS